MTSETMQGLGDLCTPPHPLEIDESESLIQRARSGEQGALEQLIETWRTYLLHVVNEELDDELKHKIGASDVVQSACLDIYRHFREFRGETVVEWKSWLRQLLAHDVQDVRRRFRDTGKRNVGRELPLGDPNGRHVELAGEGLSPRSDLIAREEVSTLYATLQTLSEEHRHVIRLRNWEKLPFDEIGKKLGRSTDAARKLWTRAVEKLAGEFARDDDNSES